MTMGRIASLAVCSVLISACAMPTSLRVASWAADGISYLATDKSVTDHGLSALSGQDCKVMRIASAKPVCQSSALGLSFKDGASDVSDSGGGLSVNIAECNTVKLARSLPDGTGIQTCAGRLIGRFGPEGALVESDRRIAQLLDLGRTDDAGLWYGVQASVRGGATPTTVN